jgi:hypothetical protein
MSEPLAVPAAHFQVGVIATTIVSECDDFMERYGSLYGRCRTEAAGARPIRVTVSRQATTIRHRSRFEVSVNDRLQFQPARQDEVLPYVEWAINWEVPRVWPEYLQLHASALQFQGSGVIFPGASGSGKSTLTAGLLARGWRYLCDEFALIHAETLALHPFPRAICIKRPSFPIIERLGLHLHPSTYAHKGAKGYVGFLDAHGVRPDAIGDPCPIRFVIFPHWEEGATPRLVPLSRADAAFQLHHVCFNLLNCRAVGLDVIAGMIRGADCFQLTTGTLEDTCALLEAALPAREGKLPVVGGNGAHDRVGAGGGAPVAAPRVGNVSREMSAQVGATPGAYRVSAAGET